ncbi:MMPL family transporter [Actinoplanes sp. CA-030573]|uniref:MMPL family transporter n=1 Tax=Actinoplanes sp. CA-030573 TaxID=3239898 RepID=UPI003D8D2334
MIDGISRTGRLVASGALILFLAFVALATVPAVEVEILATALALGIVVDALVVRALLAPVLVVLLGERSWALPCPLADAPGFVEPEAGWLGQGASPEVASEGSGGAGSVPGRARK